RHAARSRPVAAITRPFIGRTPVAADLCPGGVYNHSESGGRARKRSPSGRRPCPRACLRRREVPMAAATQPPTPRLNGPPTSAVRPVPVPDFLGARARGVRLTMLTAYDYTTARLLDAAGVDGLLVGDSLGMVVQGNDTSLAVTLDEIIYHTRLVARGARRSL